MFPKNLLHCWWCRAGVGLVLLAAVAYGGWRLLKPKPKPGPDMVAVLTANNKGVGLMERFKPELAIIAFEQVVREAPDWLPGRINLGIALLNQNTPPTLDRATALFNEILKKDPDNPYAHFCLGIILQHQQDPTEAALHFREVARIDPGDANNWYWLGSVLHRTNADEARKCFEQAVKLNPYLLGAVYNLAIDSRGGDAQRTEKLFAEFNALKDKKVEQIVYVKYSQMGHYAEVIGGPDLVPPPPTGPLPLFMPQDDLQVRLAPGARWATAVDFGTGPAAELRAAVRARFGATMVVLDYNRDGRPDLFLVGAVVKGGKVEDLLLRNDGNGSFTDVTAEAGLGGSRPGLGCCVADFDNNRYPDLFLTGIGEQHLFRNVEGRFEDVTAKAGLTQLQTVCLGAAFVDLDQDGDLDLVVAQYAANAEQALAALKGSGPGGSRLAVFLNVGEAPPVNRGKDPPPLEPRFRRLDIQTDKQTNKQADKLAALLGDAVPAVGLAVTDLDLDRDLDLFVLADRTPPAMVLNDRLLRFHRETLPEDLQATGQWNGALVLDVNRDGRSDLLLVGGSQRPVLLLNQPSTGRAEPGPRFQPGATNSPPLLQAHAIDLDLDGWTDVVGLSDQHRPVLLHNDGKRLVHEVEALGRDADWPADLVAVAVADFDGDSFPDLLVWSESQGLRLYKNQGNGNRGIRLELTGHRHVDPGSGSEMRCNADGFGAWAVAQAGDLWTGAEYTTLSAGLGQSRQPLLLGLGRHAEADVVRLRWPDNTWQAELNVPTGQVVAMGESNRLGVSCPLLFAWDGHRFGFVADFLGAGSVGEFEPDGGHRPPRAEESVKIEPEQLRPRDGHYVLKIAEPMDEVTYLDRLQLVVLDHPGDVRVYPDERFVAEGPPPSQDLLAFREEVFPVRARDHRGRDVTATLRHRDRDTVRDFAHRTWLGFAEEHAVELDFGDRLVKFGPKDRLVLCLAGWTDYPYPESIWAAAQAGVAMLPPVLEKLGPDDRWQTVCVSAGFPAGLPRMMTLEVTGQLGGPRCVLRLRTNLQVYWDQAFVAPLVEAIPAGTLAKGHKDSGLVRAACLEVGRATLSARRCVQEFSPDGRKPTLFDYDRPGPVAVTRPAGKLTRFGDVTELLRDTDDRFVLFGPGDDLTVRFDAGQLLPVPPGWTRSFVLRTWGYCKDCSPFTDTGETVEPLPFRGMRTYPYCPDEHYPRDPLHHDYRRRFNTRQVGAEGIAARDHGAGPGR
jgi:hypothetical protein